MGITPQDIAATVVAVLLTLGVIVLAVLTRPIPAELGPSLGAAMTLLFVRSAQMAAQQQDANAHAIAVGSASDQPPKE